VIQETKIHWHLITNKMLVHLINMEIKD